MSCKAQKTYAAQTLPDYMEINVKNCVGRRTALSINFATGKNLQHFVDHDKLLETFLVGSEIDV